jgi:hypothetical protein
MTLFDQNLADQNAKEGMGRAEDNANVIPYKWNDKVDALFIKWLNDPDIGPGHGNFLTEDFRKYAETTDLPEPPSKRAYGSVIVRARKKGLIYKVGYGKPTNVLAHGTPATLWHAV